MNNFTFKDLYNVYLSCCADITIGSRKYAAGEVFVSFDKLQIGNFKALVDWKSANGGFDNRAQVLWEDDKGIAIDFSQGVMNKEQFALMTGSKYREVISSLADKPVKRFFVIGTDSQYLDMLTYDDKWVITFKDLTEIKQNLVVKDKDGNIISVTTTEEEPFYKINLTPTETTDYFPLTVYYEDIVKATSEFVFGKPQKQAFFEMQAMTTFVDDRTGEKTQQLIEIPKLQITSELKTSVGAKANPVVGTFSALALPVGDRVHKRIMTLTDLPDSVAFI